VAVALGSNLGDRHAYLDSAISQLSAFLSGLRVSSRHDTTPVGVPDDQPPYLNAAAVGRAHADPHALLAGLQSIEAAAGRTRAYANAPRTLDLDLILFGDLRIEEPHLVIPHPRFRERVFVLQPLAEIAPDLIDPVTGLTVTALLERLQQGPATAAR